MRKFKKKENSKKKWTQEKRIIKYKIRKKQFREINKKSWFQRNSFCKDKQ